MKIGVIFIIYNCDDCVDACLTPWFNLRDKHDLILTITSGMFKEYHKLGFIDRNQKTLEKLLKYKPNFLMLTHGKHLLGETDGRNLCLEFLKKNDYDLLWIVGGDEIYTEKQITDIIEYVNNNQKWDVYHLQFKNYTFTKNLWMDGFNPQRIFWNNRHGGIDKFYFDDHIQYNNGTQFEDKPNIVISKGVAFIDHYTWLECESRTFEKIQYHNIHLETNLPKEIRCSFTFDDRLRFNKPFFDARADQIPILHETMFNYSSNFILKFNRATNTLHINNCLINEDCTFFIFDSAMNLIYSADMQLRENYNYFIAPDGSRNFDSEKDFYYFIVRVVKDGIIVHEEKLYLKWPVPIMEHFYQNIGESWFSAQRLYSQVVSTFPNGSHFVEVGSWKGRSASYMAVEIINSEKNIRFDCVDTWNGSEENINPDSPFFQKELLEDADFLFNTFKENISPVSHIINPIRIDSVYASKRYLDGSLDFVYIDASHDYTNVILDILNWFPKVKPGGIIAGDDFSNNWPGVEKAVRELIDGGFFDKNKFELQNNIWVYYK